MLQDRIQQVCARVEHLVNLYESQRPGFKVPKINILFDLRGRAAGQAGRRSLNYYIRFNRDMMMNEAWDHLLNDTVPHELAHIICFADGSDRAHGYFWKRTCQLLGGSGDRCHSEAVTYAKGNTYVYTTSTGHSISISEQRHRKVQAGKVYTARGRGRIDNQCAWSLQGSKIVNTPAVSTKEVPVQTLLPKVAVQTAGGSKADQLRSYLKQAKADLGSEAFEKTVTWAVATLGMSRTLAKTYVKNNWSKV